MAAEIDPKIDTDDLGQPGKPGLVLYDGVCVLCSRWFRFIAKRDVERKFYFTAIQSPYGRALSLRLGIDPDNPATNAVLIDGQVFLRSDSAIAVLSALPGWHLTVLVRIVPKPLRDALYSVIARNRYHFFGMHAACDVGGSAYADRIIDDADEITKRMTGNCL